MVDKTPRDEQALAADLAAFTDPYGPDFDPAFTIAIIKRQPAWYSEGQKMFLMIAARAALEV